MRRRTLLRGAACWPALLAPLPGVAAEGTPFSDETVRDMARDLASKPFQAQDTTLPAALANISYDQYRMLRFDKAHALWRGQKLPWQVEFFPSRLDL